MMYNVEMVYAPWNRLENYEVHFWGLVGSIEGPSQTLDLLGVHLYVLRVHWYVFCCLECKITANMANFPCGAYLPPPGLIKDSQTSAWWGLSSDQIKLVPTNYVQIYLLSLLKICRTSKLLVWVGGGWVTRITLIIRLSQPQAGDWLAGLGWAWKYSNL